MREAVGSTFLFKLMIFFIFFFASFLAVAINYSQAFKTKNQIINILEQSEGFNSTARNRISDLTISSGYYRKVDCASRKDGESVTNKSGQTINGICIDNVTVNNENGNSVYYKVTTYISFNFPLIGNILTFPVRGETKIITNVKED